MLEIATFAAGCFWSVEDVFMTLRGVIATRVGYCGGYKENPVYQDVCNGSTGHAEAVEVTFDIDQISYNELLNVFWQCHDPKHINRQGVDIGEQYRSVIFVHSDIQYELASASKNRLDEDIAYGRSIATQIVPACFFWEAEAYHQKYHLKNSGGCGF